MLIDVVVLAAGQGSRMRSNLPKVLHQIGGRPMLAHVINAAEVLQPHKQHIVVGHGAEKVREYFRNSDHNWVQQSEQLGTGHAVAQALPHLNTESIVLILYGDVPLVSTASLQQLLEQVNGEQMGLLTVNLDDPTGYGRIIREKNGTVSAIVEHKDASESQRQISEANTGIMAVMASKLQQWLPQLSSDNAQGEYYLTDIVAMAHAEGIRVIPQLAEAEWQVQGVNDRIQLANLERKFQGLSAEALMREGATIIDPARIDIRGQVKVGKDVTIDVNTVFIGDVKLADGVNIGPNCIIEDSSIAANTTVKASSVIEKASIGSNCDIGPFARLRPGTDLKDQVKIGNFVETKKSIVKEGSKVNHLSYIGDCQIGQNSNIGAGTITCNYDGANKHVTQIGDHVFVGSNTSLVAPIDIANNATIGAGSTVTVNVGDQQLAVARGRQKNIDNWVRPKKK